MRGRILKIYLKGWRASFIRPSAYKNQQRFSSSIGLECLQRAENNSAAIGIVGGYRMASDELDRKYSAHEGRVFMSGTQALVRLPMVQMLSLIHI